MDANDIEAIQHLRKPVKHVVLTAFSNAIDDVFLTGVPFVAVAFVVAFFLEELPLRTGREIASSGDGRADEVPVLTEQVPPRCVSVRYRHSAIARRVPKAALWVDQVGLSPGEKTGGLQQMTLDPQEAARAREVADTPEHRMQVRRAALASTVGTTIEWYDYFLYGTASALVLPKVFFPGASPYVALLESFATYFVGFAARPVGAAIFGHWGDRIGRKRMLIVTLLMMGIASTIIGVLPGAASIGAAAPILLVLMRIFQGIAVGGEWSGSVLLSMEWGNQKRRGLFGSWPQLGVSIGLILGTALFALFNVISGPAFLSWGWRIPFLLSLVLVAIGLYIRLRILETPMFARVVQEQRVERAPVALVIRKHPKEIILSALLRMSEQAPFYVITTFVLAYLTLPDHGGFSRTFVLVGTLVAAFVELLCLPYFAHLSDTVGRKRIYLLGAAIMGVWGFVFFAMIDSGIAWVVFIALALGLVPHAMQYGPQASLIAESFPTRLRYGGAGLGYQLASIVAGGPAALIATALIGGFKTGYAISVYILFCAIVTIIAGILLPDRSKVDLEDDTAYGHAATPSTQPGGEGPQPTAAG